MKLIIALLISMSALADCDVGPLREQLRSSYLSMRLPIQNEHDEIVGHTQVENMKVSEHVLLAKYESFLVATFDIAIPHDEKKHNMTVVANVDMATCQLEPLNTNDLFGSSIK